MTAEPILTAAETRAAEQVLFDAGLSVEALMVRAGEAAAAIIVARFPAERPVLVACGPGNNGGDGYVVARALKTAGRSVRVFALAEPRTDAARDARSRWDGPVATDLPEVGDDVLVDALFGSGANRPLDGALAAWLAAAPCRVAIDLPSGIATDTGAITSPGAGATLTIALGCRKPAHVVMPGAAACGEVVLADIGLPLDWGSRRPSESWGRSPQGAPSAVDPSIRWDDGTGQMRVIAPPVLRKPGAADNKYTRGKVVVVAGAMVGAANLTALAAMRSGAGYVELVSDDPADAPPHALVRRRWDETILSDRRVSAVAIGPGLGDHAGSRSRLEAALASRLPIVLDAGALTLLGDTGFAALPGRAAILTPHGGEFARVFGPVGEDPVAAVRSAAARTQAVVLLKGAATLIAAPDGRVAVAAIASPWLASAGTGDVLAGIAATMLAQIGDPFAAAQAATWLHAAAAERAGPALIADDLIDHLPAVIGSL